MLCGVEIELPLTHFPCSLQQIFFQAHLQPTQTSAYEQAALQAIFVPASSGAQGMKERELLSQPKTVH